ncbi:MAG: helix-hairpin-helix domain-containing protein, partial [Thermoplasmata archaeon]
MSEKDMEEMNRALVEFTKIPGVGLSKAKKLFEMGYRTMDDLKKASFEELAAIKGIGENRATLIKKYFAEMEGKKEGVAEEKKEAAEKTVAEEKAEAVEAKPEKVEAQPEEKIAEEVKEEAKPETAVAEEKK